MWHWVMVSALGCHSGGPSSLHWLVLIFFYTFFLQWSIVWPSSRIPLPPTHPISLISSTQTTIFLKWLTGLEDQLKMYLCPKIKSCTKRASKIIVQPQEMLLLFSIGTFLTNYDVIRRNLNTWVLHSIVRKQAKMSVAWFNGDYWPRLRMHIFPSFSFFAFVGLHN